MSFNVCFKGRLGADPDISFSPNGTAVAKMRLVTNRRRLVDGDWQDTDTSWWQVTAFGKTADAIADNFHKGDLIIVEGRIKQREWEKDGIKRTTAEVTADEVAKVVKAGWKAPAQEGSPDPWATEAAPF